jgi:hypothetical protein
MDLEFTVQYQAEASQEFEQTCQQMQGRMKLFGAV